MVPWAIALHGGAGNISKSMDGCKRAGYEDALRAILDLGVEALTSKSEINGRPPLAIDVAELVVRALEDNPLFNAGRGSVLTRAGTVEMEASIMTCNYSCSTEGLTPGTPPTPLKPSVAPLTGLCGMASESTGRRAVDHVTCGAVSGLMTVVHPITVARLVMERTPHVYLAFEGAEEFASEQGVERQPNEWFVTEARQKQWEEAQQAGRVQLDHSAKEEPREPSDQPDASIDKTPGTETVGCVVVDSLGRCAAATSTGGLTNKMVGRIGDTPVIGAGNYANSSCAVSATGVGEHIIRAMVGREVAAVMEYKGLKLEEAAKFVVGRMAKGTCGLIAVSKDGDLAMEFNTVGMFRACAREGRPLEVAIW